MHKEKKKKICLDCEAILVNCFKPKCTGIMCCCSPLSSYEQRVCRICEATETLIPSDKFLEMKKEHAEGNNMWQDELDKF